MTTLSSLSSLSHTTHHSPLTPLTTHKMNNDNNNDDYPFPIGSIVTCFGSEDRLVFGFGVSIDNMEELVIYLKDLNDDEVIEVIPQRFWYHYKLSPNNNA